MSLIMHAKTKKIKKSKLQKRKLKLTKHQLKIISGLNEEQIQKIADKFYKKNFSNQPSEEKPLFYFAAGAIGSGKTHLAERLNKYIYENGANRPIPIIDRDTLREWHTNINVLRQAEPVNWVRLTDDVLDARDKILERAVQEKKSLINETTLSTPQSIQNLRCAKKNGTVIIGIVSLDPLVSKTKAFLRYVKRINRIDNGEKDVIARYESNDNLNRVLNAQKSAFNQIEKEHLANIINFYDYDFKLMCSVESAPDGTWKIIGGKFKDSMLGKNLYEIYKQIGKTTKHDKLEQFSADLIDRFNTFKKTHPEQTGPIKEISRFIKTELTPNLRPPFRSCL